MDAIDAALVQFKNNQTELIEYLQYPIDENTKKQIRSVIASTATEKIDELDKKLGRLFAETVKTLMQKANVDRNMITAIGSHGQTIWHEPNAPEPFSLQIANPELIAGETGILTVADFRSADIAAGGQGAPLAPAFHQFQFRHPEKDRVILNIGGMANVSILPADRKTAVTGFDTGPGNALMDDWVRQHQNLAMDKNGAWACSGNCDQELLSLMLNDEYFQQTPPKSTGIEHFNLDWLSSFNHSLSPEDVQATLLALTTETITQAIKHYAPTTKEVLVCGGGVHNKALMLAIKDKLPDCSVASTGEHGLEPDCIEAVAFAWLAKQRLEEIPANLPTVTGAKKEVLLGTIYDARS